MAADEGCDLSHVSGSQKAGKEAEAEKTVALSVVYLRTAGIRTEAQCMSPAPILSLARDLFYSHTG